jgi:hypothetical protein
MNDITSRGLPQVTRLLQDHTTIIEFNVIGNPGLFTDKENTRLFTRAVQNSILLQLCLDSCRLPDHAFTALSQAVSSHPTIVHLCVFDDTPLQGAGLACLLDNLPKMSPLRVLHVKLDYADPAFVSSLRKNKTLCLIYKGVLGNAERTTIERTPIDPVFAIMKRNQRLLKANRLLENERQTATMFPAKVWGWTMALLARDDGVGATAVYTVLCEKLACGGHPIKHICTCNDAAVVIAGALDSHKIRLENSHSRKGAARRLAR